MSKAEKLESPRGPEQATREELKKLKSEVQPFEIYKGVGRVWWRMVVLRREGKASFWNKVLTKIFGAPLFHFKKGKAGLEISYKGGWMSFESKDKSQYFEITFFAIPESKKEDWEIRSQSYVVKLKLDVDKLDLSSPESVATQLTDEIISDNQELNKIRNLIEPSIEEFVNDLRISKSSIVLKKEAPDEIALSYRRWGAEYALFLHKSWPRSISLTSIIMTGRPTSIEIKNIKDVNDFNIKLWEALDLLLGKLRDKIPGIWVDIYTYFFGQ